jgi:hypothetical protein
MRMQLPLNLTWGSTGTPSTDLGNLHGDSRNDSCFDKIERRDDRRKPRRSRNSLGLRANVENPAFSRRRRDSSVDGVHMEPGSRSLTDQHAFVSVFMHSAMAV